MAGLLKTSREFFGDRAQNFQETSRADIARALNQIPFLQGRLISVQLTAGTNFNLTHGLGVPAAFFVVRQNYDGTGNTTLVTESSSAFQTPLNQNQQIAIVASVSCIVDLWVYRRASATLTSAGQSK